MSFNVFCFIFTILCTRSLVIIFYFLVLITSVLYYYGSLLKMFVKLQMTAAHSLNSHGILVVIIHSMRFVEQVISYYPALVYIIKTICVILCLDYFIMVLRIILICLLVCIIQFFCDILMMKILIRVLTVNVFYFCNFFRACRSLFLSPYFVVVWGSVNG